MCSLQSLTCLQVQVLPRQWMVGPSSPSRIWLGETPAGASSAVNGRASRRRKLAARVSRGGPSWTEFARLADQAVVALGGAGMINRAEPRACRHSRGSRRLDSEPEDRSRLRSTRPVQFLGTRSAQRRRSRGLAEWLWPAFGYGSRRPMAAFPSLIPRPPRMSGSAARRRIWFERWPPACDTCSGSTTR